MGAWAEDTFGNDAACDWTGVFLENPGLEPVRAAIDAVLNSEDDLDSDEACDGLAACEISARWQGRWGIRNPYSAALDEWIEANPMDVPSDMKTAADSAIEKILGPNSELRELWDDGGRNDDWHNAIDDLRARVRGA